jgi:hypothetical protein
MLVLAMSMAVAAIMIPAKLEQIQVSAFTPNHGFRIPRATGLLVKSNTFQKIRCKKNQATILHSTESSDDNLPEIPFLTKTALSDRSADLGVGEDAGIFDIKNEKWGALGEAGWFTFSAAVATILTAVAVLWVYPPTGYADDFTALLENIAGGNSHLVTLLYGIIFPVVHSGLASLRPLGEKLVGARAWRVVFAFPSLCLSYSWITYFISHAHDGLVFYDISHIGWVHGVAWFVNFLSFLFLYPSVYNLKEVAAVEKPKVHLWETGIIRITRHPQFVGQAMWYVTPAHDRH